MSIDSFKSGARRLVAVATLASQAGCVSTEKGFGFEPGDIADQIAAITNAVIGDAPTGSDQEAVLDENADDVKTAISATVAEADEALPQSIEASLGEAKVMFVDRSVVGEVTTVFVAFGEAETYEAGELYSEVNESLDGLIQIQLTVDGNDDLVRSKLYGSGAAYPEGSTKEGEAPPKWELSLAAAYHIFLETTAETNATVATSAWKFSLDASSSRSGNILSWTEEETEGSARGVDNEVSLWEISAASDRLAAILEAIPEGQQSYSAE